MKVDQLLYTSICEQLQGDIQSIKEFEARRNSPAFIRIEGGHIRPHFIAKAGMELFDATRSLIRPAEQEIKQLLGVSEKQKEDMLATLNRMLPNTALIMLDTDSEDFDSRTQVWFIA